MSFPPRRNRIGTTHPLTVCALCLAMWAASADAQSPHRCATVADATERLACFDRAFPRSSPPSSPRPAAPTAAQAAEPPASSRPAPATAVYSPTSGPATVAGFGLPAAVVPVPEEPLQRITALVTRIDRNARGERSFFLDNGQQWVQVESGRLISVAEGARVTIERAAFGGYRLVTPAGAGLRVRRLP